MEKHIRIPIRLLDSTTYNLLTPYTQRVLMIFMSMCDYDNPDNPISLSYGDIERITGYSRSTVSGSIKRLLSVGYIQLKRKGSYRNDASEYLLGRELFVNMED